MQKHGDPNLSEARHEAWLSNLPLPLQRTFEKMDRLDRPWAAGEENPLSVAAGQWIESLDGEPEISAALAECLEEDPFCAVAVIHAAAWLTSSRSLHLLSSLPGPVLLAIANATGKNGQQMKGGKEIELMEFRIRAIAANCLRAALFSKRNIETVQRIILKIKGKGYVED